MLVVILVADIDGNATGPLLTCKVRAFNPQGGMVVSGNVQTQVLASDTAAQMQAKCKTDIDTYIQLATGAAVPSGSNYVVFGGRSN